MHHAAMQPRRGHTYEQGKGLLELGDLLLGERISLRLRVSSRTSVSRRVAVVLFSRAGYGQEACAARGKRTMSAVCVCGERKRVEGRGLQGQCVGSGRYIAESSMGAVEVEGGCRCRVFAAGAW